MEVIKMKPVHRVFVAGDAHYRPGQKLSAGHLALCTLLRLYQANVVVMNGDAFDFPTISKYGPLGWKNEPTVKKEIETVQARLEEIQESAAICSGEGQTRFIWTLGNHDARFDKLLATKAPQIKGLPGTKLDDYFPDWEFCQRVEIGDVVIKHELKGGANPLKSNMQAAGKSIVTGHHHCQNVLAYSDYAGTRYAVDHGCLASTEGPQWEYGEGDPKNWRSGFAVLQFYGSKLMPPQLATVLDEKKKSFWYNGLQYYGKLS